MWSANNGARPGPALPPSAPQPAALCLACMVIAVVSPKGGAGKTTCTALHDTLFAELRHDPVFCMDANPDFGNLKAELARPG